MDIVSIVEKAPANHPQSETSDTSHNIAKPGNPSITPPQEGVGQSRALGKNDLIETVISARQDAAMATPPKTPMAEQHQPASLPVARRLHRSFASQKSSVAAQAGASTIQPDKNNKQPSAPGPSTVPAAPKETCSFAHTITSLEGKVAPIQSSRDCFTRAGLHSDLQIGESASWLRYIHALGLKEGEFPKIHVEGKMKQSGKVNKEGKPDWNFAIYTVLAVSPNGRLKLKQIFNICLAWSKSLRANNASCRHTLCIKPEFVNFKDELAKDKNDGGYWRLAEIDEGQGSGPAKKAKKATKDQTEIQSRKRKVKTSTSPELPSRRTTVQNAPATAPERSSGSSPRNIDSAYHSGNSTPTPQTSQRPVRVRKPALKRTACEQDELEVVSDTPLEDERGGNSRPDPQTQVSRKRQRTAGSQAKTKSSAEAPGDQSSTRTQCSSETQSSNETHDSNGTQHSKYTRYLTLSGRSTHTHFGSQAGCSCIAIIEPKPEPPPPRLNPIAATGRAFPNGWIEPPLTKKDVLPKPPRTQSKKNDKTVSVWMDRIERDAEMERRGVMRYYIPAELDYGLAYSTVGRECDLIDSDAGVVKPRLPESGTPLGMAWVRPFIGDDE